MQPSYETRFKLCTLKKRASFLQGGNRRSGRGKTDKRLLKSQTNDKTFSKLDPIFTKYIIIQIIPLSNIAEQPVCNHTILVGYTATKRLGKAVTRNKCKRRMRMISRELFGINKNTENLYQTVDDPDNAKIHNFLKQNAFIFVARPGLNYALYSDVLSRCKKGLRFYLNNV